MQLAKLHTWYPIVTETKEHCFTWTEDQTLAVLGCYASQSKLIVESGVYMGASSYMMMRSAPADAHMWGIDKFMVSGTEFVTRREMAPWIKSGAYEIIVGDSERGGQMLSHIAGKVDLIWIDDGHAEEDVLRDIRCLTPLLRSGGVMLGHDFDVPHNDVARGVIRSGIPYDIPCPRVWRYVKP